MARFFVGQRVKLVRIHDHGLKFDIARVGIGAEGRVTSVGPFSKDSEAWDGMYFAVDCDLTVTWYGFPVDRCCMSHEVEPILDQHTHCESEFKESLDRLCENLETIS